MIRLEWLLFANLSGDDGHQSECFRIGVELPAGGMEGESRREYRGDREGLGGQPLELGFKNNFGRRGGHAFAFAGEVFECEVEVVRDPDSSREGERGGHQESPSLQLELDFNCPVKRALRLRREGRELERAFLKFKSLGFGQLAEALGNQFFKIRGLDSDSDCPGARVSESECAVGVRVWDPEKRGILKVALD